MMQITQGMMLPNVMTEVQEIEFRRENVMIFGFEEVKDKNVVLSNF